MHGYQRLFYQQIKRDFGDITDLIIFGKPTIDTVNCNKLSIKCDPEMDQASSDLIQEKLIQWAINDSGYKP